MTDQNMIGHNATATDDRLRLFVERIERMEEEEEALKADKRDIYAEAKGTGYDPKILRKVIQIRKMDPDKRREQETLVEVYLCALGMV